MGGDALGSRGPRGEEFCRAPVTRGTLAIAQRAVHGGAQQRMIECDSGTRSQDARGVELVDRGEQRVRRQPRERCDQPRIALVLEHGHRAGQPLGVCRVRLETPQH